MEIKQVQRHFGCISTTLDDGSKLSVGAKQAAILSWRPATQKIRVFGTPVPIDHGISIVKSTTPIPTMKAVFEDYYLAVRGKGPLVIASPTVSIKPVCLQLCDYAESKNMGISWGFYAFSAPGMDAPDVFGLSATVVKILSQETPDTVLFKDGEWQDWLFKWMRKYMQAHRYFDATRFLVANKWPADKPYEGEYLTDGPINVYEKMKEVLPPDPWSEKSVDPEVSLVNPMKKKRGRPAKSK